MLLRAGVGHRRSLARAITLVELRSSSMREAMASLSVRRRGSPGAPHVIGLTGPPGGGKSTLANELIGLARQAGQTVAVVAVDPSSPFSGGAILGDRVRMDDHTGDDGVFIRSLSSRGTLGGLSAATSEVVDVLDASGFDVVIVETVGVGQSELAVMEVADTVIVVLTPESGDTVQTMKAGLLEIADIFVVNKSDRPGALRLVQDLERSVEWSSLAWPVPVHQTSAINHQGLDEVFNSARSHLEWCCQKGIEVWRRRRGDGLIRLYLELVAHEARAVGREKLSKGLETQLRNHEITPWEALGESSETP
ncbi:MAG: methylmalonyl Co-A mutase-associated GTPase MeaB [Proteobacteria bacterium]|nr:methylmalonyl Co-A mutase-associated GTPase MeaB [Pseudomonadota bacterium]